MKQIMNKFLRMKISLRAAAAATGLSVIVLAGCTMIPKYQQPTTPISSSWPSVPGYPTNQTAAAKIPAADIGWRDFFRDPRLQQIVELALTNNPSLIAAVQNVEQTRQLYHVQIGALIPTVSINANGQRTRTPNVYTSGPGASSALQYTEYNLNLGVTSYELDLFGQVRSLTRQALETYFATDEARRSAQIALVAQVGAAYVTEQEAAQQLALARDSVKAARQSFDLTKRSFEAGVSSQFDLNNASTQLQNATAAEAGYAQQYAEAEDNLNLLAGKPLPPELQPTERFNPDVCLSDVPAGLPSDLLERRPDIMEAEHQLRAANASIGAARAALFPTVTLTGSAGLASTTLESLFAPGSHAWGFSPQIQWPVLALGTAYHQLKADEAEQRVQVANYQSAVQTAFKEVADALAVRTTVQSQLADNEELVKADQQSYDLTKAGFNSGVNSALDLDVTQLTLDSAQQSLIQAQYSRLISLINLYQALGGGWNEQTVQATQQSAQK
jgi:outer membrane protein, multidrug efflux system